MLRRCVQGIFRYRPKPQTTSTEKPFCDAQMRHPLTSSGLISEPYTWNANYEVEWVGSLNQIKLRYNTHIYIYICICIYVDIYIYIRGCTKPCTGWYRKYSHIRHETLRMWFGRTAFAAGWFLCYCRAGKGGGRPKFLQNFFSIPSILFWDQKRPGKVLQKLSIFLNQFHDLNPL